LFRSGLVERPRSIAGGEVPRLFYWRLSMSRELSVFIDESGDFGEYDFHSPFYIITMVFHDQDKSIQPAVEKLNLELSYMNMDNLCIHTGPIIRKEESYNNMDIKERRRIFNKMIAFIRQVDIRYSCFFIEKKEVADVVEASGRLSRQIARFIREHYAEFLIYDAVKVYYDNGQVELTKILSSVFYAMLSNVEFRRVMPENYKLFQAADLLCTMELVKLKLENNMFSKSEEIFFGNQRDLKRNYLKPLQKKEWE